MTDTNSAAPQRYTHTAAESSAEDLAVLRNLLDLALQPLDSFDGFSHVEQLFLGALRYQLNSLGWALSLAQATRTPAFTGYLADAQRAAILKMCDRKVWGYWAYQELAGYGRWNPDPIVHANVMYSGYLGVMIGLYESLNHDGYFNRDDALTLRWNDRKVYRYSHDRIAEAVQRNMLERPGSPQYPCEPHLIYPVCNTFALNTLRMSDRLHETDRTGDLVDRVRVDYDTAKWRRPDGRFLTGRARIGWPVIPPVLGNDAWMAYWLHSPMPDVATATWDMITDRHVRVRNGQVAIDTVRLEQRLDPGNYSTRSGGGPTYAMTMKAAGELGAHEIHDALRRMVDERFPLVHSEHGAAHRQGMSNFGDLLTAMARFGGHGVMRSLIDGTHPACHRTGPVLTAAPYPDVLVARAVSDGSGLDLVLRPGNGATLATLTVEKLVPGETYTVTGATESTVVAGGDGSADITVDLRDRTEVRLSRQDRS